MTSELLQSSRKFGTCPSAASRPNGKRRVTGPSVPVSDLRVPEASASQSVSHLSPHPGSRARLTNLSLSLPPQAPGSQSPSSGPSFRPALPPTPAGRHRGPGLGVLPSSPPDRVQRLLGDATPVTSSTGERFWPRTEVPPRAQRWGASSALGRFLRRGQAPGSSDPAGTCESEKRRNPSALIPAGFLPDGRDDSSS